MSVTDIQPQMGPQSFSNNQEDVRMKEINDFINQKNSGNPPPTDGMIEVTKA